MSGCGKFAVWSGPPRLQKMDRSWGNVGQFDAQRVEVKRNFIERISVEGRRPVLSMASVRRVSNTQVPQAPFGARLDEWPDDMDNPAVPPHVEAETAPRKVII